MKLSELVSYRNHLEDITPSEQEIFLQQQIDPVVHSVKENRFSTNDHIMRISQAREDVSEKIKIFLNELETIKKSVDREIERMQPPLLSSSYSLYESMKRDSTDHILNRRINITNEIKNFVSSRLNSRSAWHHSAMIIRPGLEDWIEPMVAFDPLYVVDTSYELLSPARSRFNDLYQSRVRWTVVNENTEGSILTPIPDAQISFCVAWNFFHYKPFEVLKAYLTDIYQKLSPGGIVAFSFNDGDRRGGVDNAERMFMCFTPGKMIQSLAESLGYVFVMKHTIDNAVTWIEFKKPGNRVSLKGGQALARVIPKPKPVDTRPPRVYTEEEIKSIKQQAIDLNIDLHGRSIEKLEALIQQRKGIPI